MCAIGIETITLDKVKRRRIMDYISNNIAMNLKRIRASKGVSLDVVAEQTGVSKSMLAQIEKGSANPSIGVLGKIASGLRITFTSLIEAPPAGTCLMSISDTIPTKEVEGQYRVWTCFPYEDNRMVEIYRIELEPNGIYVSGSHGEKTREYISMIEGKLDIELEDGIHSVDTNDVFRFESDQIHTYRNPTSDRTCFMSFFVSF